MRPLRVFVALLIVAVVVVLVHFSVSKEHGLEVMPASSIPAPPPVDWKAQESRIIADLQAILKLKTVRGNERAAAEWVKARLAEEGVEAEFIDVDGAPDRAGVRAVLPGKQKTGGLILAGHLDVVEAQDSEWTHPPFEAQLVDGRIYGRGAVDMKGMAVMELHAFLAMKRSGVVPEHPVMLLLTADEESGSVHGVKELVETKKALLEGFSSVLEEGGVISKSVVAPGVTMVNLNYAEKGVLWLKAKATGPSGHGSSPPPDYATTKLLSFLRAVDTMESGVTVSEELASFFFQVGSVSPFPNSFVLQRSRHPLARIILGGVVAKNRHLAAMTRNSRSFTGLSTPEAGTNVITAEATAKIDVRLLPGVVPEEFLGRLKALGAPFDVEIEVQHMHAATTSPVDGLLFRTTAAVAAKNVPEAVVAPFMSAGGTDCTWFRSAGLQCYGLIPAVLEGADIDGIHGKNENITTENLLRGTRIVYEIAAAASL